MTEIFCKFMDYGRIFDITTQKHPPRAARAGVL